MSPRLLTESSRRSSWLYWSFVTPNHTHAPSVITSATTESAATMTMMRSDSVRASSSYSRSASSLIGGHREEREPRS